ncbi:cell division protein FtsI/penicillin-binding protein 2 [Corynebacterium kutscheri]|uniref:Cell division protein FtsI/penicillin-binding protein 2 n=1 Tax=Corynebacterium kutscheri TaxID=35755 RepID=A0A0F6QYP7_9CORY|nr:penicillin-binding protein 2 [Corynebacterium kutscheri]AKE40275.1 cell division protein FtsI/penicillin-binding protein 2 [Corynebacterium kutscheri]VEH10667.1 Penicillin-binding protein A [Corynebacterium kutscheri]
MNRSIRFTAVFALLLVTALLVNITVIHAFREDEYANNALNRRHIIELRTTPRGHIAAGGEILAESYQDENGFYQRRYVANPIAYAPVEGYLSNIYGTAGIEASYNDVLNGQKTTNWWKQILNDAPTAQNIELTLNPAVQNTAYSQLANAGYEGAVVALRASTGEVLAMASTPSFDPNAISDDNTAADAWAQLNSNPGNPLLNHATQETLPPGSTFKVITTAAGLAAGYTPERTLTGAAETTLPGTTTTLENYGGQSCAGSQTVTLLTAFQYSCNTAFVEMGIDTGGQLLRETATAFGIGDTYDLGLPMVAGTLGELADDAAIGQSAIGQRDVSMSVLHNAVVAATIANKGKRMEPHIVSKIIGSDLSVLKETTPTELNQAVTPEVAATITDLMYASERHTLGYNGQNIASKTGTAEHGEDSRNSNPHAWYIAFSGDIAVAVVVKNGGDAGQAATGGSVAAPIGRAVIAAAQG